MRQVGHRSGLLEPRQKPEKEGPCHGPGFLDLKTLWVMKDNTGLSATPYRPELGSN